MGQGEFIWGVGYLRRQWGLVVLRKLLLSVALASATCMGAVGQTAPADPLSDARLLGELEHAIAGSLSPTASTKLQSGERMRVIVMFEVQPADLEPGVGATAPADAIATARDEILNQAFPGGFESGPVQPDLVLAETSRPTLYSTFQHTPGFAIYANGREIVALRNTYGVVQVREDKLDRTNLAESIEIIGAHGPDFHGEEGVGVGIAVLDTGIELEHEMFTANRFVASACFNTTAPDLGATSFCPGGDINTDLTGSSAGDSCVEDDIDAITGADGCFHGTHVGSIAGGRRTSFPDGSEISGVARAADLIPVNVFSRFSGSQAEEACGGPDPCVLAFVSDQIEALEWLYDNRDGLNLGVINMSLGGEESPKACPDDPRAPIITALRSAGVATVIASGNDGFTNSVSFPACIPDAITVGATDKQDVVAEFSNSSDLVDFLAPGVDIFAAFQSEFPAPGMNCQINNTPPTVSSTPACHWYATVSGTSMAAPHVAGAIANLQSEWGRHRTLEELLDALYRTAVYIEDDRNNRVLPRIQVDAAQELFMNGGPGPDNWDIEGPDLVTVSALVGDIDASVSQTYQIVNSGAQALSFSVRSQPYYITLSKTEGAVPAGGSVDLTVTINPRDLAVGQYTEAVGVEVGQTSIPISFEIIINQRVASNDDFENARPITRLDRRYISSNAGAGRQLGEPAHTSGEAISTWWRWTAPFTENVTVQLGADADTTLSIYTGSSLAELVELELNGEVPPGAEADSDITFAAIAGETYYMAVATPGVGTGYDMELTLPDRPPNWRFANAEAIGGVTGSVTRRHYGARRETGEPRALETSNGTLWYAFTAPSAGRWIFNTYGSESTAILGAYTGPSVDQLTELAWPENEWPEPLDPRIELDLEAQQTVYLQVSSGNRWARTSTLSWAPVDDLVQLFTAVLPSGRSIQLGQTATGFMSVYNDGDTPARGCVISAPVYSFPGELNFQTTDPATNALTGTPNTPVDIAPNSAQTFVFSLTPSETIAETSILPDHALVARCSNALPAPIIERVNTFTLEVKDFAPPDIIPIAITPTQDGIVSVPGDNGVEIFTVAAINIGTQWDIDVVPVFDRTAMNVTVCETDAAGTCLPGFTEQSRALFETGQTRFYTVRVEALGPIAFDPANQRIELQFIGDRGAGRSIQLGSTNVAVRSQ